MAESETWKNAAGDTLVTSITRASTPPPPPPPPDPDPDPEPEPEPEPTPTPTPVGGLPYSADSYFKSRCDKAPVDAARTSSFRAFMAKHPEQVASGNYPKINVNPDWAMSYYVHKAGVSAPIWKLAGGNTADARLKHLTTQGFHMSDVVADTFPNGDQDRPGVMIDYEFGYTVQFADAVPNKTARTITVSNAACFWHNSNGLDYRVGGAAGAKNFSSRGRIPDAMVVRRDLLNAAIAADTGLGHMLHLFFVETNTADGKCLPMAGLEGEKAGWGAEGERIRIAPGIDLKARGLTGGALAIARTLQQHGAYLGDNSGSGTQIKAAQPQFYVGTNVNTDAFKGKITWNDFEVIPKGWK